MFKILKCAGKLGDYFNTNKRLRDQIDRMLREQDHLQYELDTIAGYPEALARAHWQIYELSEKLAKAEGSDV